MDPQLPPADPTLEEQLVAYLDGELDAESCRRIEDLLTVNPEARLALQRLEKTWELLDALGTGPTGENFTRSTLEMVAVAAEDEVEKQAAQLPRRRRRRGLLAAGVILAAGVLGFLAMTALAPDANRRLLEDLPLLENLDQYRQAESLDFLRLLQERRLFTEAGPEAPLPEQSDRQGYVERMSSQGKADLARRQERFNALDPAERKKLRALQERLEADPQAAAYRRIMDNYYAWWKTLPFYDRAELTDLPPVERVRKIEELRKTDLSAFDPKNLSPAETAAIRQWSEQTARKRLRQMLEELPKKDRQEFEKRMKSSPHPWAVLGALMRHGAGPGPGPGRFPRGGRPPRFEPGDLEPLLVRLTPETRRRFEQLSRREQFETLHRWQRYAFQSQMPRRPTRISADDRLAEFFENEDEKVLTREQRDQLLNLPSDEMQSQLLRLYFNYLRSRRPPGPPGRGEDGPPDFRPGPPGPRTQRPKDEGREVKTGAF
ncbi:MAG: hypothetical protein JXB10_02225 [Pirellulales bacterium]|nr:hypothetical protein [Pirellulales bacterium]